MILNPGVEELTLGLQDLESDVSSHRPDMESVNKQAIDISRSTQDPRTATYAAQLNTRFTDLTNNVAETRQRVEDNVDKHAMYNDAYHDCSSWLADAIERLEANVDFTKEKDGLQENHDNLQVQYYDNINAPPQIRLATSQENGENQSILRNTHVLGIGREFGKS